ncbi:MAG: DUF1273 family protein [Clostridia bacterium]|nr:DUF1273 family protein [Clostridia bacterium]
MIVTFCGHRNVSYSDDVERRLEEELRKVLEESPEAVFYLGDYGRFDGLCNSTLRRLQREYPLLRRVFVTPYLDPEYAHFQDVHDYYDEVMYPFSEKVLKRFAISKRNRWMVEKADFVIAYVNHDYGGAATTLEYALRKKKKYVNLGRYL